MKNKIKLIMRNALAKGLALVVVVTGLGIQMPGQPAEAAIVSGMPAIDVLGQWDADYEQAIKSNFTRDNINGGPFRHGLNAWPVGADMDLANRRLFISDSSNSRVLVFNTDAQGFPLDYLPDNVLGQPSFTGGADTSVGAANMNYPYDVLWDGSGQRLFVSDTINNRVLVFDLSSGITDGMNAANVLGQGNFTSSAAATTQAGMSYPYGLAWDPTGSRLFVVDDGNSRTLVFDLSSGITDGMNAANVLGQGNFTSSAAATTQAGMFYPVGIAWDDTSDRLFVGEWGNNRALVFDLSSGITDGMNAANVLGQENFVSGGSATDADGLYGPYHLEYDAGGQRLFVADASNNRVVVYDVASISDGEDAVNVLGQGTFTSSASATSQSGFSGPAGVTWDDANDRLFVGDGNNARYLTFDLSGGITDGMNAESVIGQFTYSGTAWPPVISGTSFTAGGANGNMSYLGFDNPRGVVIDSVDHRMFVCDYLANRVLVYNLDSQDRLLDRVPDNVIGQVDFATKADGVTQSIVQDPHALTYDENNKRLFIAERDANRVTVYDLSGGITNGMSASYVLGQDDFTSSGTELDNASFNEVSDLEYDPTADRLFLTDRYHHRVLVFDMSGAISNGMAASYVIGQDDFVSEVAANTADRCNDCLSVDYDETGQRLFVGSGSRVLVFDLSDGITNGEDAVNVLGQENFVTNDSITDADGLKGVVGIEWDDQNDRLFLADYGSQRIVVHDLSGGITDGRDADYVIGQPDFVTSGSAHTQSGMGYAAAVFYDAVNDRLIHTDRDNNRIMFYDVSTATGTTEQTTENTFEATRLAAGESTDFALNFTLSHVVSTQLTVTFPAGFTVNSAATAGASSSCLSNFGFTSLTLTADKTDCAGPITLGGANITLPSTPGNYTVTYVNDDPGEIVIPVTDDDAVSVYGNVDPTLTFDIDIGTSSGETAQPYLIDFGQVDFASPESSDNSSLASIWLDFETNATAGGIISVRSANAAMKSVSTSDEWSSATASLAANTEAYGICVDTTIVGTPRTGHPGGTSWLAASPYDTSCTAGAAMSVGALQTSDQTIMAAAGPLDAGLVQVRVGMSVASSTPAHPDYQDILTFTAVATY